MRLDIYLTEKNENLTRSKISDFIKRGYVFVDGKPITKPGFEVLGTEDIEIIKDDIFASRAGEKLKHAVDTFGIDFTDKTVIDVGASTGGFTDVALEEGALKVYAYDVGSDQLIDRLKNDPRVLSFENTNILDVVIPKHDITVIDVSFTSVFPILTYLKDQTNEIVFLLKPQFEAEKQGLSRKGVLKDPKVLKRIMEKATKFITSIDFKIVGFTKSPIKGKEGNEEFLFFIKRSM